MNTHADRRTITTRVDRELAERLEQTASEQERTVSAEIRVALRQHLDGRQPRVHVPETDLKEVA